MKRTISPRSSIASYKVEGCEGPYQDYLTVPTHVIQSQMEAPESKRKGPRGGVSEPFPVKLYEMLVGVEGEGLDHIVCWSKHGRCFTIHHGKAFVAEIMPRYFKQTKLTSFQRQLNLYGFQRYGSDQDRGAYYHPLFLRGRPDICTILLRQRVKGGAALRLPSRTETATTIKASNFYELPHCPPATTAIVISNKKLARSSSSSSRSANTSKSPTNVSEGESSSHEEEEESCDSPAVYPLSGSVNERRGSGSPMPFNANEMTVSASSFYQQRDPCRPFPVLTETPWSFRPPSDCYSASFPGQYHHSQQQQQQHSSFHSPRSAYDSPSSAVYAPSPGFFFNDPSTAAAPELNGSLYEPMPYSPQSSTHPDMMQQQQQVMSPQGPPFASIHHRSPMECYSSNNSNNRRISASPVELLDRLQDEDRQSQGDDDDFSTGLFEGRTFQAMDEENVDAYDAMIGV